MGFVTLTAINFLYPLSARTEELLRFQLNQELKKGNFFIGLKQHLGGQDDNFSINNNITFETDKKFLSLYSLNGIKHKSKKINIILKEIPTNVPLRIERFVLGPYSSYESAEKQANRLKERGFDSTIAYPKNWEVWIPITENLPQNEFEYKIVKKTLKTQISPFLNSEYTSQKLEAIYISSEEDIKINSINYGKQFYLIQDSYGTWTLIQKIKFDNYLEGVLPHEIGSNSPLGGSKAQAVIARTGIYNSARFRMDKYHLCVTTQCQVYKPPKFENLK